MDASVIGKRPTELMYLFSPEAQLGAWAPPLARISADVFPMLN